MRAVLILFLLVPVQSLFAQLDFLNCPKDSTKRFVRSYKLIPSYFDSVSKMQVRYDTKPDTAFLFKYEKKFECGTNGHWEVSTILMWSVPITKTEFILNITKSDSLHLPIAYFMGSGGGSRYNFYATSAEGWIKGKLVDNYWLIEGNLTVSLFNSSKNLNTQQNLRIVGNFNHWIPNKKNKDQHPLFNF